MSTLTGARRVLATLAFAFCVGPFTLTPAKAQIPVTDALGLIEWAAQTIEQIEQTRKQIAMLEDMGKQAENLANFDWDDVIGIADDLLQKVDMIDSFMGQYGGLDGFLDLFQDIDAYRLQPCLQLDVECSADQIREMLKPEVIANQARKQANDRVFRGIKSQQENMTKDAANLRKMMDSVQAKDSGREQTAQAAAQIAGAQANQLMQIRSLLIAQQSMQTTQAQAAQVREAREHAAGEALRKSEYTPTGNAKAWW